MSIIKAIIPAQSFEILRDRICEILTDEISNQYTLTQDENLKLKVWRERTIPFDQTELPAVNVMLVRGESENKNAPSVNVTYTFYIECHAKSKTTSSERGDTNASIRNHQITGVVRAILDDAQYKTLGFNPPFIGKKRVLSIDFANAETTTEMLSIAPSRLAFQVTVPETVAMKDISLIAGYQSKLKLNDSEKGFYYSS
jgi:hypothetical protein